MCQVVEKAIYIGLINLNMVLILRQISNDSHKKCVFYVQTISIPVEFSISCRKVTYYN